MSSERSQVEALKPLVADRIAALVARMTRYAELAGTTGELPRPRPPASPETLESFEKAIGFSLPSSYRAFLELHDGYDYLIPTGPMFSSADAQSGGPHADSLREWKETVDEYDDEARDSVLRGLPIAFHGQPNNWAYIDPLEPRPDGELAIFTYSPEMNLDFSNLLEFFDYCIQVLDLSIQHTSP